MRDTLRTRMGWLHSWVGFVAGLALTVIFAAGTMTVFDTEIGRWMQPEIHVPIGTPVTPQALDLAGDQIETLRGREARAFLNLPSSRDPMIRLLHHNGHEFVGPALDPRDGHLVTARETIGGQFFYDLHFTLRSGHDWGRRIVDTLGLAMLVAIGSGVIIHIRSLLPDMLLFRPFSSAPRAWLDAHVLAAVLFLPFITLTAYTGVVVHSGAIFPDGGNARHSANAAPVPEHLPSMASIVGRGEQIFGKGQIGFVLFGPETINAVRGDYAGFLPSRDQASFSYADGTFVDVERHAGIVATSQLAFRGLHYARWAPLPLRWLYFMSGVAGSIMMASGLIMFLLRYRRLHTLGVAFRVAEALAMAVMIGFPAATLGLLWSNRIIPPDVAGRAIWETRAFFGIWSFSLAHALVSCLSGYARQSWRQQLVWVGVLGVALPLLDIATRPEWWRFVGLDVFTTVDLAAFLVGICAWYAFRRLSTRTGAPA